MAHAYSNNSTELKQEKETEDKKLKLKSFLAPPLEQFLNLVFSRFKR